MDIYEIVMSVTEECLKDYKSSTIPNSRNRREEMKRKQIENALNGFATGCAEEEIELAKRIKNNVEFEFIQLESYEGEESTGVVKLRQELTGKIEGKNIIIIEDIIDTGRTLEYLREHIKKFSPKSVRICTLLSKPSRRIFELNVDYIGFSIPDEFVVGFGMDYNQKYRNLPYIGKIG